MKTQKVYSLPHRGKVFFTLLAIATFISILLTPTWYQFYSYKNVPIEIVGAGQAGREIRVYWDDPLNYPEAYTLLSVNHERKAIGKIANTPWPSLYLTEKNGNPSIAVKQVWVWGIQAEQEALGLYRRPPLPKGQETSTLLPTIASSIVSYFLIFVLLLSGFSLWKGINSASNTILYTSTLSITTTTIWLSIFYPGYITGDAFNMWYQAKTQTFNTWYPPATAMLMSFTFEFTNGLQLFSWIQGIFFVGTMLLTLRYLVNNNRLFLISSVWMTLLIPSLWIIPVTLHNNIYTTGFISLSTFLLVKAVKEQRLSSLVIAALLLGLAASFRRENVLLVIIPILVLVLVAKGFTRQSIWIKLVTLIVIPFLVIGPGILIEKSPAIVTTEKTPLAEVFINQYVGTIHNAKLRLPQEAVNYEKEIIDTQFGAGSFDNLLNSYQCKDSGHIYAEVLTGKLQDTSNFILSNTFRVMRNYPLAFLEHKACNLSYLLQVPAITHYYNPKRFKALRERVVKRSKGELRMEARLPELRATIISLTERSMKSPLTNWLFRHYIFIAIAFFLLIYGCIVRQPTIVIPAMMSLFVLSCFLVPDNFAHFRYLLPSYVSSWLAIFASLDYCFFPEKQIYL